MAEISVDGKRRAHPETDGDDDLEASLEALTTMLGAATTHDQDTLIATICDVLGVDAATAAFCLEASNNDPHAAVQLHVQSGLAAAPRQAAKRAKPAPVFAGVPVTIAGLPPRWSARVSTAGTVVFVDEMTGYEQATMPPGFAPQSASASLIGPPSTEPATPMEDADAPHPASPPPSSLADYPLATSTAFHGELHPRVMCDACDAKVAGIRYTCLTRFNFDLCERCFWSEAPGAALRSGHRWMKMSFVTA